MLLPLVFMFNRNTLCLIPASGIFSIVVGLGGRFEIARGLIYIYLLVGIIRS